MLKCDTYIYLRFLSPNVNQYKKTFYKIKKFLINILNPYLRAHIRAMRSRVRARNSYCLQHYLQHLLPKCLLHFLHRCLPPSPTRLTALVAKPIAKRQPTCRAAFHTACQTANILFSRHILHDVADSFHDDGRIVRYGYM